MKILIVSRTPWDISNSFGNTFSNLFDGMKGIEIFHICCQHGTTKGSLAKMTFQMTDRSVMHSILEHKSKVGWIVKEEDDNTNNAEVSEMIRKRHHPLAYYVRDLIWTLGAWKQDADLKFFLSKAKPDVLYFPLYNSCYICEVQKYISDLLPVPVVVHISDDEFAIPHNSPLLKEKYARKVSKKMRLIIERCSYMEVFAENMQQKYMNIFHKTAYLIGKGVDISDIPQITYFNSSHERHFTYTGNIGTGRWRTLLLIGKAMEGKAVLDIYSATLLTVEMKTEFDRCKAVRFHGVVSADKVREIQKNSDVLVHVEGFSSMAIEATRMSFSTKLIDYMMAGKPIFAVGNEEINSIAVLKKYGLAVVAVSLEEIDVKVNEILSGSINIERLEANIADYLINYRDIRKIQDGISKRLKGLVGHD